MNLYGYLRGAIIAKTGPGKKEKGNEKIKTTSTDDN